VSSARPAAVEAGPPLGALFAERSAGPWLFGRRADQAIFGGSALLSIALLGVGWALGILESDTPEWVWLGAILFVDIGHVWSTLYRVYLDGQEVRRRPLLYLGTPVACYVVGVFVHSFGALIFWRALAYFAVYHFVRQQYGWLALYRRRAGETSKLDYRLDTATIYAATLYPLIWWHAHLPRNIVWFMQGDFVTGLTAPVASVLAPVYWGLLVGFVLRQGYLLFAGGYDPKRVNWGKVQLVGTTWFCWWLGIMAIDGDYAFTVTNVLIHGIPYLYLTYRYGRARREQAPRSGVGRALRFGLPGFIALLAFVAFSEESLWDSFVWHDHEWLFGAHDEAGRTLLLFLVPLLAMPQLTHYVLDGFIWKMKKNRTWAHALDG